MSAPPRAYPILPYRHPSAASEEGGPFFQSIAQILSGQGIGLKTVQSNPAPAGFSASDFSRGISKQKLNQLHSITLVREQREKGRQEIGYHARPFVLCGIPLRRPPATELVHRRQNGKFFLEIVAHPHMGCYSRGETEKPHHSLRKCCRDA
jgi:hypothetical protein